MNDRLGLFGGNFDSAYAGIPPWDIGHPQPAYVDLAQTGQIRGSVLDVGCGTGEHALYLAQLGHEVWGIDASPTAIEKAQAKSTARGVDVAFRVADALKLQELGRTFDTAIDSGLVHVFSDEERLLFVSSLASALKSGGTYYLLCFSDQEDTFSLGPRRVSKAEIYATFREGWSVKEIRATRFENTVRKEGMPAWLATITRLEDGEEKGS
ncbi:MAG TPA: class I SAM-dependent methyltransferase [Ktedonobacteraceae bacterium]